MQWGQEMKARLLVIIIVLVLILQLLGCWNVFSAIGFGKNISAYGENALAVGSDLHTGGSNSIAMLYFDISPSE